MNNTFHIKVFLADDHPVVAYGVSTMLAKRPGIEIVGVALTADEMMRNMPKACPTILLLDLHIPGSDFYENIAWVKARMPWVKIIVYSGYHSSDVVRSLMHEGVKGYLPKTVTPDELCEALLCVASGEVYVATIAHAQTDNAPNPSHLHLNDDFRKRLALSRREQEVLVLISKGLSSQSIGKTLYISKHTVETHRKNILRKLDFNSSTELVKFAVQQGLV